MLDPPRPPIVAAALDLAKSWCHGHSIDDAPALAHAARVARTLVTHLPAARANHVAAALLHDAPRFAPPHLNLPIYLDVHVNRGVGRLVAAIDAEHFRISQGDPPVLDPDPAVTLVLAADSVVAFRALLRRAARSGDPEGFFASRHALRQAMPYFHQWCNLAEPALPVTLAAALHNALSHLDTAVHGTGQPTRANMGAATQPDAVQPQREPSKESRVV